MQSGVVPAPGAGCRGCLGGQPEPALTRVPAAGSEPEVNAWRPVSTLDLVAADAPDLLLLVGAGAAARAWAAAATGIRAGAYGAANGPRGERGAPAGVERRRARVRVAHVCRDEQDARALLRAPAASGGWQRAAPSGGASQGGGHAAAAPCVAVDRSGRWAALREARAPRALNACVGAPLLYPSQVASLTDALPACLQAPLLWNPTAQCACTHRGSCPLVKP